MVKLKSQGGLSQDGQAITEYILLVAILVSLFAVVSGVLRQSRMGDLLMRPLREEFARIYQYGHPQGKGYDDGGPEFHPRAVGGNNFRIFIQHQSR